MPVRILASSSAESARRASDTARDATYVAAAAMEQYEVFKVLFCVFRRLRGSNIDFLFFFLPHPTVKGARGSMESCI